MNDEIVTTGTCPTVGFQQVDVCVPVSVKPFAKVGEIITKCCGEAIITPGTDICSGVPGGTCDFTITQKICIEVPVEFGADADAGEAHVRCNETSDNRCDNDCDEQFIVEQ